MTFNLGAAVQDANGQYPGGCPACRGIRFKICPACGLEANSFHDHREYRPARVYDAQSGRESQQRVPDRPLQPPHKGES